MTSDQAAEIVSHLLAIRIMVAILLGAALARCLWRKY